MHQQTFLRFLKGSAVLNIIWTNGWHQLNSLKAAMTDENIWFWKWIKQDFVWDSVRPNYMSLPEPDFRWHLIKVCNYIFPLATFTYFGFCWILQFSTTMNTTLIIGALSSDLWCTKITGCKEPRYFWTVISIELDLLR